MAYRLLQPVNSASIKLKGVARYHDYVRVSVPGGSARVPLSSPKVIGVSNSRGNRGHQEDFYAFATLSLNPAELQKGLKQFHKVDWDPSAVGDPHSRQVLFVGLYDGHGGSAVAQYLRQELHGLFESAKKTDIPEVFQWVKEIGGYFKRFKGGPLTPWLAEGNEEEMDLEARATLTFFEVDRNLSSVDRAAETCGATASVAILQSLDAPATPFFSAKDLCITVAHCGDTKVLISAIEDGKVFPMTEKHHADGRVENKRLRKMMGSSLITDSFGESRWMGALQNTRSLGDLQYKKFGITSEPEVRTKMLRGQEWASMILVSDGVSSILSDQEIADLTRNAPDPKVAAERIVSFSQELGGDDNATAIVVPLAGWGKTTGPDQTKELREYRQKQSIGNERQKRM
ncbi:phosphatase 2C-like domain-containing protein [Crepidotus variabilis]|uniref:Phosphatase 2C-like domain-containing protein n=1 Tax=Crepidotus variabilis TaxID=179855 RepID=A0A9P6JJU8_9AGAR|nr:phosphatase 2C-like domain-containing protein [Crepidotus variabilis]